MSALEAIKRQAPDTSLRVHAYNSPIVMDLAQSDAGICSHPLAGRISFRQPCVNTFQSFSMESTLNSCHWLDKARNHILTLQAGEMQTSIPAEVPLVTYITRCFEPYRGWPQVAEGLALLMQRNPRCTFC